MPPMAYQSEETDWGATVAGLGARRPVAVITGATSGIGAAFADQLAARGCDLLITGRRSGPLEERRRSFAELHGVEVKAVPCELSNRSGREPLLRAIGSLGRVDWLINNAGHGRGVAFSEDECSGQLGLVGVHVEAVLELTHCALTKMPAGGRIITVSSLAGFGVSPRSGVYCAAKAFATSFSESLALELKPRGIRAVALLPGFTHTDFHRYEATAKRNRGLVRWMQPDHVARSGLRAADRGQVVCIPGLANLMLYALVKLLPRRAVYRIMAGGTSSVLQATERGSADRSAH